MQTSTLDVRDISVRDFVFSKSKAQMERRDHFDDDSMKELAASIKEKGIIQPIVARPAGDIFEVVAGERRVLAAKLAGLDNVPAIVRELTDEQALDVQLIENLQREGLHELVECEGYEDLKDRGHTVEQIAVRVGKSTSYVYKRLELSACGPDLRKAFYDGKIDVSKALFLSRLIGNDLQKKALKDALTLYGDPMSYRTMVDHVRRNYMQRLDQAPFKTEDPNLVPAAGACGKCPKNTAAASQTALFGDVSNKDAHCTDGKCFQQKTAAATATAVTEAKAAGKKVLEGSAAKKALQGTDNAYTRPGYNVQGDSQYRTYEKVLGKDLSKVVTIAVDPSTGAKVELVDKAAAKTLMKEKGVKLQGSSAGSGSRSPKESEKAKAERQTQEADEKYLVAVAAATFAKKPKPLSLDELAEVAECLDTNLYAGFDTIKRITGKDHAPDILKLNEEGAVRWIRALLQAQHIEDGDRKVILDEGKRHGVDVEKVKAELEPKPAPAKTKGKKAAKKK